MSDTKGLETLDELHGPGEPLRGVDPQSLGQKRIEPLGQVRHEALAGGEGPASLLLQGTSAERGHACQHLVEAEPKGVHIRGRDRRARVLFRSHIGRGLGSPLDPEPGKRVFGQAAEAEVGDATRPACRP